MSNELVFKNAEFIKNSLGKELNNAVPIFLAGFDFCGAVASLRNAALYGRWFFTKKPMEVDVVGSVANLNPFLVFAINGKTVAVVDLANTTEQNNPSFDILFDEVYLSDVDTDAVSENVLPGALTWTVGIPAGGVFIPGVGYTALVWVANSMDDRALIVDGVLPAIDIFEGSSLTWVFPHSLVLNVPGLAATLFRIDMTKPDFSLTAYVWNGVPVLIGESLIRSISDPLVNGSLNISRVPGNVVPAGGVNIWRRYDDSIYYDFAKPSLTKLLAFGDSFTYGYGVLANERYPAHIAFNKSWGWNQYAVNSTGWLTVCYNLFANFIANKDNSLITILAGFNNFRTLDTDNILIAGKVKACLRASLAVIWSGERYAIKTPGYAGVTRTGTWADSSQSVSYPTQFASFARQGLGSMGMTTTVIGSKINFVTQFACTSVVVGFVRGAGADTATFNVKVDGILLVTSGNGGIDSMAESGSTLFGTLCQDCIVIRGLSLAIHTVVVELTSGAGVQFDWIGTLKAHNDETCNPVVIGKIPYQKTSQAIIDHSSIAEFDFANAEIEGVVSTLFYGFPLRYAYLNSYFDANNPLHLQADLIHPSPVGMVKIFDAFMNAINS